MEGVEEAGKRGRADEAGRGGQSGGQRGPGKTTGYRSVKCTPMLDGTRSIRLRGSLLTFMNKNVSV